MTQETEFYVSSLSHAIQATSERTALEASNLDSTNSIDACAHAVLMLATASAVLGGDVPIPEDIKARLRAMLKPSDG